MARKNRAAVALGRLGGKARAKNLTEEELSEIGRKAGSVGGRRRAETLSGAKRSEIAKKAAAARWKDKDKAPKKVGQKPPGEG